MDGEDPRISQLSRQLEELLRRHENFTREIQRLKAELLNLKDRESKPAPEPELGATQIEIAEPPAPKQEPVRLATPPPPRKPRTPSDLERFIGENLINKIGIFVLVIGVAIGAKYAIDHQLISPLTRIILGYFAGLGLMGFALALRRKYTNFSAVLLSGSLAILYFITYFAYAFYGLIPQLMAFALMVIFTGFTVVAALSYNLQVIALFGLVGAYAVPFLLSTGSGQVVILFSYITLINIGIMAIAFYRYWKPLYYAAFGLTWLIYAMWHLGGLNPEEHFTIALVFAFVFFAIFYATFLGYKFIRKESFEIGDVVLLLANSFLFYGFGYSTLESTAGGIQFQGLFTLANAATHFIVTVYLYRLKLADKGLFYLASGLVLLFITLTIPIQLDGNWVTLLWIGESALLFWIGRKQSMPFYERLSMILLGLAVLSLLQDWTESRHDENVLAFFNIQLASSTLFIAALGFINYYQWETTDAPAANSTPWLSIVLSGLLVFVIYFTLEMEIARYWTRRLDAVMNTQDDDLGRVLDFWISTYTSYKEIWILNYTLLFCSGALFLNRVRFKVPVFDQALVVVSVLTLLGFLTIGLETLSELRRNYLEPIFPASLSFFSILIRYICYILFFLLVKMVHQVAMEGSFSTPAIRRVVEVGLHITILWIASSELINLMDLGHSQQTDTFGLSILWGIYSLLLVAFGIWKAKRHLRIAAIVLFAITLLKLFFYDLTGLSTIAKTIVLVSLGILLLVISFLYNKYKHLIVDAPQDKAA